MKNIFLIIIIILCGCCHDGNPAFDSCVKDLEFMANKEIRCQQDLRKCNADKFDMQIIIDEKGSHLDACLQEK